jgi:hypothetical protein
MTDADPPFAPLPELSLNFGAIFVCQVTVQSAEGDDTAITTPEVARALAAMPKTGKFQDTDFKPEPASIGKIDRVFWLCCFVLSCYDMIDDTLLWGGANWGMLLQEGRLC